MSNNITNTAGHNDLVPFNFEGRFPPEVREMIWKEVPEQRFVEVRYSFLGLQKFHDFVADLPPILQVNQESRRVGLKVYELTFISEDSIVPVYFNYAMDTLMPRPNAYPHQLNNYGRLLPKEYSDRIERIAVDWNDYRSQIERPFVSYFPNVKHVTLLFEQFRDIGISMGERDKNPEHTCPPKCDTTHFIDDAIMYAQPRATPHTMEAIVKMYRDETKEAFKTHKIKWKNAEFVARGYCTKGWKDKEWARVSSWQNKSGTVRPLRAKYVPGTETGTVEDHNKAIAEKEKKDEEKRKERLRKQRENRKKRKEEGEKYELELAARRQREEESTQREKERREKRERDYVEKKRREQEEEKKAREEWERTKPERQANLARLKQEDAESVRAWYRKRDEMREKKRIEEEKREMEEKEQEQAEKDTKE